MKALLDEHLSPLIATSLRQSGFDVLAVADRGDLAGRSDRMVLEVARDEGRAVVTNNVKDFRPLAAEFLAQSQTHAGLILLPSSRTRTHNAVPAIARAIEDTLRANPEGIAGSERWIGPLRKE